MNFTMKLLLLHALNALEKYLFLEVETINIFNLKINSFRTTFDNRTITKTDRHLTTTKYCR